MIVVGILIAVTAFIAYNAGKNKGRFISEGQDNRNSLWKYKKNLITYDTNENQWGSILRNPLKNCTGKYFCLLSGSGSSHT